MTREHLEVRPNIKCCMKLGKLATDTFLMFEEAGSTEIADVSLGPAREKGK